MLKQQCTICEGLITPREGSFFCKTVCDKCLEGAIAVDIKPLLEPTLQNCLNFILVTVVVICGLILTNNIAIQIGIVGLIGAAGRVWYVEGRKMFPQAWERLHGKGGL